jgi:large subunit ribosomal protein L35
MPKMKSHRGAAKRFRRRNSGKIRRGKSTATHNLAKKSSKRKMHLRRSGEVHEADRARVEKMLSS